LYYEAQDKPELFCLEVTMTEDVLIRFRLAEDAVRALYAVSAQEMRKPHDQVRYMLIRELERLGWLRPSPIQEGTNEQKEANL
jgi:hypothetical protein